MSELEASWGRSFVVWWCVTWRTVALALPFFILAIVAGSLLDRVGYFDRFSSYSPVIIERVMEAILWIAFAVFNLCQFAAMRSIFDRSFGSFRVRACAGPGAMFGAAACSWRNTLILWWAFTWRLYGSLALVGVFAQIVRVLFGAEFPPTFFAVMYGFMGIGVMQHLFSVPLGRFRLNFAAEKS